MKTTALGQSANQAYLARISLWVRPYIQLAKARMTTFILLSVALGFVFAGGSWLSMQLFWTLLGSMFLCISCFALNQVLEVEEDRRMLRTCRRPLPLGELGKREAWVFGIANGVIGSIILGFFLNAWAVVIGLSIVLLYGFVYTPAKKITTFNTLIGAIPGALPPVLGWVAVQNGFGVEAAFLFALLFFWQLPHFLSIAWMCRDDYARGGFVMLSLQDTSGLICARQILWNTLILFAVCAMPLLIVPLKHPTVYACATIAAGLGALYVSMQFIRNREHQNARYVFFGSLIYLPWIYLFLLLSK